MHEEWKDTGAAYLLGALPEDERAAFEAHLAGCPECRAEIEDLAPAVHALPAAVEPLAPPPTLRDRVMAEVEREADLLAAAGPGADRPQPRPRRRRWSLPRALAPVAVAAALVAVGVAGGFAAAGLLGDDAHTVVATVDERRAPGAEVALEVADGGSVMLVAHGLPAPPRDRVYQVWLKRPGQAPEPTSALFTPSRDGTAMATVPGPMDEVQQVLVTDEPQGGSSVPTRDPLVVADIS
jgi:anti-sigma-K factor RskA